MILSDPSPYRCGHGNTATTGAEQHDLPGSWTMTLGDGVVQRHGHAGRTGITPLIHYPMSLLDRLIDQFHHVFNRAQVELGEKKEVNIFDRQIGFFQGSLHQFRPIFGIEGLGEFLYEFNMWGTVNRKVFGGTGAKSATGVNTQGIMIFAYSQQVARKKTWLVTYP